MAATPIIPKPSRLAYIDWMRGLAVVFMFQTHCYDAWLGGDARHSSVMEWSQRGGTLPALLFLSLAGASVAFVTSKMREQGASAEKVLSFTFKRGAEIFAYGIGFRVLEYALGLGWAPWTDLFRVDVLNIIGLSMIAMAVMNYVAAKVVELYSRLVPHPHRPTLAVRVGGDTAQSATLTRLRNLSGWMALTTAIAISALSPMMWTVWRPRWLPWELETYINGVHIYDKPQSWLFPIFPWMGLAFLGLALGFVIGSHWAKKHEVTMAAIAGLLGVALFFGTSYVVSGLTALGLQVYPTESYDFWHTSVDFFVIRFGLVLMVLWIAFAWCRWGWGARPIFGERFTVRPLISLGQNSMMVYVVHIEMVYGLFTILKPRAATVPQASMGLFVIFLAMLVMTKTRFAMRGRWKEVPAWVGLGLGKAA